MNRSRILAITIFLFSCGDSVHGDKIDTSKSDTTVPKIKNTDVFKSKLIVILGAPLESDSSAITLQDFEEKGKSFIPCFTSKENYKISTGGAEIGKGIIEIDGVFLLSLLKGNETLRLNPTLDDEEYFNASFLIQQYKTEIDSLKKQMQMNQQ